MLLSYRGLHALILQGVNEKQRFLIVLKLVSYLTTIMIMLLSGGKNVQ